MFDVVVLKSPDVLTQFGGGSVLVVEKCCDMISISYFEFVLCYSDVCFCFVVVFPCN